MLIEIFVYIFGLEEVICVILWNLFVVSWNVVGCFFVKFCVWFIKVVVIICGKWFNMLVILLCLFGDNIKNLVFVLDSYVLSLVILFFVIFFVGVNK